MFSNLGSNRTFARPASSTENRRVKKITPLVTPGELKSRLPVSDSAAETVTVSRNVISNILHGKDGRFIAIVGPCSIHNTDEAIEYADRLAGLSRALQSRLFIVMRVYFEKPRTSVGWQGLINDPRMKGSGDIANGLWIARRLLQDIVGRGLPVATEFLDPIVPQFTADLVTWGAVGARTTESQTHRMMASGLSMPVGFKNGTNGGLEVAVNAMISARTPHHFIGMNDEGVLGIVATTGNEDGHVVMRGGDKLTNYDATSINIALEQLRKSGLPDRLLVDCSHANSSKQHVKQESVWQNIVSQRAEGTMGIMGGMIESNLHEGAQKITIPQDPSQLRYGVSVTDECVSWETTERMLRYAYDRLG